MITGVLIGVIATTIFWLLIIFYVGKGKSKAFEKAQAYDKRMGDLLERKCDTLDRIEEILRRKDQS